LVETQSCSRVVLYSKMPTMYDVESLRAEQLQFEMKAESGWYERRGEWGLLANEVRWLEHPVASIPVSSPWQ
jgi:hypothetical protein